jgi:PfaD family protein
MLNNGINFSGQASNSPLWIGDLDSIAFEPAAIKTKLLNLDLPCYLLRHQGLIGISNHGNLTDTVKNNQHQIETLTAVPPLAPQQLGDRNFQREHRVKYSYMTGAMANGIASAELVIALGKENILGSFGAAGLIPARVEQAINLIQAQLIDKPYAFNLIHSPNEPALERANIDLYLKYGITTVEASAFLDLTPNIVYYRVAGLSLNSANTTQIKNKIIAKISRPEVAIKFLQPPPESILKQLLEQGLITPVQAKLAANIPMADDITVEADSGGHTDNRPLVSLLPTIIALRDEIQTKYRYPIVIRIGAAGGISTPRSALGAWMMGADYVVTGSINQSCVEAGSSKHTKNLLAQADIADVMMAPAADMFEMGVKLQVLKKGTLFPIRAQKLFELYNNYDSIESIPLKERDKLEKQIFRKSLDEVWQETETYFAQRDVSQITRDLNNPKRKMALIFRWYLGLSSRWSNIGELGREMDYQIWCGPAMGAFNNWVKDSYLAQPQNRRVVDVAHQIVTGAAYLYRLHNLKLQSIDLNPDFWNYHPQELRSWRRNELASEE